MYKGIYVHSRDPAKAAPQPEHICEAGDVNTDEGELRGGGSAVVGGCGDVAGCDDVLGATHAKATDE